MRTTVPMILMLLLALSGCKRGPRPPSSPKAEDPVVAAVQGVNRAVKRTIAIEELHDLHLTIMQTYGESGSMPTKEFIMDLEKKQNRKLYDMFQDGTLVLTNLKAFEGIWAYEKDADKNGGIVLTQVGASRLTTEEAKQLFAQYPVK